MQNEKILAYLEGSCLGKANRSSGTELERILHISGTCLRKQVNRLRCKEYPIASDRSGYFYATNVGEVYDTIRQLKQMVSGLEAAISGLERSMERFREHGEAGHGYQQSSLLPEQKAALNDLSKEALSVVEKMEDILRPEQQEHGGMRFG